MTLESQTSSLGRFSHSASPVTPVSQILTVPCASAVNARWPSAARAAELRLVETKTTTTGVIIATYVPQPSRN